MRNLVFLPFLFTRSNIEASCTVIREMGQCFSVNNNNKRSLNVFKHVAKYLTQTTEFDIIKHKEVILTPPAKSPDYFHYQLATVTTKKISHGPY